MAENDNIIVGGNKPPVNKNEHFLEKEFKVITENIPLPSKGVFYPTKQDTVKVKYLTAEEDDILYSPELIKSNRVLDALLQIAVVDDTLKADDMLIADRNSVLIHLRRTGLGEIYNPGPTLCPSCKEEYFPDVDLNKLKLKYLENEPDENGEYEFEMPLMKSKIKFRFLNGHDENRLSKLTKDGARKKNSTYKISKLVTERYKLQIMEVDGIRDKLYIAKFVSAMPMKDSMVLREYLRIMTPGIDFNYEFTCKNCGHVYEDDVNVNARLFYPDAEV